METLPTCVALDLETTGLDPERDTIIEIGAVKFRGDKVLDTYHTLVNPYRELPPFVRKLTGISQANLDGAPPFGVVAGDLRDFVASLPIVGHSVSFDLSFLTRHGLPFSGDAYDTLDLAAILLPYQPEYSLMALAALFGGKHDSPHRALSDAEATHGLFIGLMEKAQALDPGVLAYLQVLASRARWPVRRLFESVADTQGNQTTRVAVDGVDWGALSRRLETNGGTPGRVASPESIDEAELSSYLEHEGLFAREFPGFQHRPQQVKMMRAVAGAFNDGEHLVAEAGTGVGKSVAYLLPAVLFSAKNNTRVIISTNTINLQEQLLHKDIPALLEVLESGGILRVGQVKAAPLKGRANYLCVRRWDQLARDEGISSDDVRLLGKTLVWMQNTSAGDRAEINLAGKDAQNWGRVSAEDRGRCPGPRGDGPCFLRAARQGAEGAHVVVVNHALLLSDLAAGGGLLPEYDHIIIDEAQHLEEEATRRLGFTIPHDSLADQMEVLVRLAATIRVEFRTGGVSGPGLDRMEELLAELETRWSPRIRQHWAALWGTLERFLDEYAGDGGDRTQTRIAMSTRAQPAWSRVEIAWEDVDAAMADGSRAVSNLRRFLEPEIPEQGASLALDLSNWQAALDELRDRLKTVVSAPAEEGRIDWADRVDDARGTSGGGRSMALHSAPLNVGEELKDRLFSKKRTVVLTSATLSAQDSFAYIRERVGLDSGDDLLVGSPFDYQRSALMLVPDDIPTPEAWGWQSAMEGLVTALAKALGGHTLVLFTSRAALRGAARGLRAPLESENIRVLAQGLDGGPRKVLQSFAKDPRSVILGTSSFWEGVDIADGALKALVIARLPFHVPTEPVFEARSSAYEDPFRQYALPQAVLRFRQGIGRLIRRSQDRGVFVVLDRRIIARAYGKAFLDSIPPCTTRTVATSAIPDQALSWLGQAS